MEAKPNCFFVVNEISSIILVFIFLAHCSPLILYVYIYYDGQKQYIFDMLAWQGNQQQYIAYCDILYICTVNNLLLGML